MPEHHHTTSPALPPRLPEPEPPALAEVGVPVAGAGTGPLAPHGTAWSARLVATRVLDIVLATLALVFLLPMLLIVALLIKLDTPGPVLFRQRRLGKDMRPFTMLKFRTMGADVDTEPHRRFIPQPAQARGDVGRAGLKKLTDDRRVTRVGATLRRFSIDEIPQLLNVLAGQMALVGPRPAIEYELEHYEPTHFERFEVHPGITGLWQVSGRSRLGLKEMLDLDAQYVTEGTLGTDLKILARTPLAAVRDAARADRL